MQTTYHLRPYGPGKFATMLDAYVYSLSLNGCDEETGDVSEYGLWAGLLKGFDASTVAKAMQQDDDAITPDEAAYLCQQAGAIITDDDQGFVDVAYYETSEALAEAWADIQANFDAQTEDED